jgi:hypothetical protein
MLLCSLELTISCLSLRQVLGFQACTPTRAGTHIFKVRVCKQALRILSDEEGIPPGNHTL